MLNVKGHAIKQNRKKQVMPRIQTFREKVFPFSA